ncbi:phage tail protein [Paenibacillus oralis]|uniref:Phage tail protein n=1 Tax=Paenibacillus oralis TaxID=2490856 RepID=A0A3P3U8A9_9BACL|nr:phage tail domain-containing protein [Paenibacillus oralis]RRJ66404.1 phage tail protein [Paenibacillus oralis]
MAIRDSLYFSYAGIVSEKFGVINVNVNSGMQEEALAASREANLLAAKGRDRPYLQSVTKSPLKFNVSFAFEDYYDTQKLREVARWLTEHDYYQELYFTNEIGRSPERIFYAIVVDDPTLVHNCLSQGYVSLTFLCDSPYSYSPVMTSRLYQWEQSAYSNTSNDFRQGDKKSLVVDADGSLILNPQRIKWSDFPYSTKWADLDQQFTA